MWVATRGVMDALCGTDNFDGLQSVKLLLVDEKHPYISSDH